MFYNLIAVHSSIHYYTKEVTDMELAGRECRRCKQAFTPPSFNSQYCSPNCRAAATRIQNQQAQERWRKNHGKMAKRYKKEVG